MYYICILHVHTHTYIYIYMHYNSALLNTSIPNHWLACTYLHRSIWIEHLVVIMPIMMSLFETNDPLPAGSVKLLGLRGLSVSTDSTPSLDLSVVSSLSEEVRTSLVGLDWPMDIVCVCVCACAQESMKQLRTGNECVCVCVWVCMCAYSFDKMKGVINTS